MTDPREELARRAASRKVRGKTGTICKNDIDVHVEDTAVDLCIGPNDCGAWVQAWLFVSESEINDAEDNTP